MARDQDDEQAPATALADGSALGSHDLLRSAPGAADAGGSESLTTVLVAFGANVLVAVAKSATAAVTGSASLRRSLEPGEYTSGTVRAACERLGIRQSAGRPGSALDNAAIESWHSASESGLRSLERFATRAQARARVAAWIDEYNTSTTPSGGTRRSG